MLVIRAVAKLNDPSMFLLVAGTGPDGAGMQQEAKQLLGERALFLGAVPDSDLFYRTLDVFAMPSTLESFGIVYVEAALRGVPSVASPTGGVPYVVAHGESGLMVDKTVDGVAAALYRLRADPAFAKALGKQARRRALEEFSDTAMAEHYRDLFNCKHSIIP
jgi:glycosyltransferase involved in cell wall biosynthesis